MGTSAQFIHTNHVDLSEKANEQVSETKQKSVRIIAHPTTSWIEGEAVRQLEHTASLAGVELAVGLPDLHPGKGHPIGAAFLSRDVIYPHLVGGDIGCGMALWRTDALAHKPKLENWAKRLAVLDKPWSGEQEGWHDADRSVVESQHEMLQRLAPWQDSLGSIGGGNHFAEMQAIDTICDEEKAAQLGIDPKHLYLLVHSGSRGLGTSIHDAHVAVHGARGVLTESDEGKTYIRRHNDAVSWASINRRVIARRFLSAIEYDGASILDICHNSATPDTASSNQGCTCWLHRKGAAPADVGPVVIPGSRGALSYLVVPTAKAAQTDLCARSLAHGAGRKWKRSECKARLADKYKPAQLEKTALGGRVVCNDRGLLYEEAPQAYKDVTRVIDDLLAPGLVELVAILRPVLTFKTARHSSDED